ncbi:PEP-CTERM sorting domain-containing protein [Massilia sp.]|uniref:PEP-CTERM sorting domain-containing protein n=1 Tax=Massilia sp. TaxID=1882437 RepID=UPI00289683D3|nr:PEP-CTERM sorting domain-containing protein [Massilia sp.]
MSIRHLVVAALLASAGAAQADVVSTASQPTFVNGWTAANGTNVLASGVLGSDVSLVGGIAHSTGNSANLTNALAGNASAYMSSSDAQKLFVQQGIDASYLLSAGNGLLAARYGNSTSVINDGDGVKIVVGANPGVGAAIPGAGSAVGGAVGGGSAIGGGDAVGGGGAIGGGTVVGGGTGGSVGGGNAALPGTGTGIGGGAIALPAADPILQDELAAVPEPGTVALMLAGLIGAGSLSRRRAKR